MNTSRNRNTKDDSEYIFGLESKLVRVLSLIQKYKDTQKYGEELARYKKALEQNKELDALKLMTSEDFHNLMDLEGWEKVGVEIVVQR